MTQVPAADRCSARSATAGEPMAGTAGHAPGGYLLLEEPSAWAPQPFGGDALDGMAGEVDTRAGQAGVKALLFRAGGRRERAGGSRRVLAATVGAQRRVVGFTVADAGELRALRLSAFAADLRSIHPDAREVTDPLLLVCTHAKRDQCCAIRGVPLVRSLGARYPGQVLQCSHLGGHRFAATALALPSGAVYGRLSSDLAEQALLAEHAGSLVPGQLRGMSHLPQPAQAVDVRLRTLLGLTRVDDVRLVECTKTAAHMHRVRMTAAARSWRATVRTGRTAPKPPSCGKPADASKVHTVVALDIEPARPGD